MPLRVTDTHSDALFLTDRVDVQLTSSDRRIPFRRLGERLAAPKEGPEPAEGWADQEIQIPASAYRETKDHRVRAELEYSLTLFALRASNAIPALGGDERMPRFGWCKPKMNEASAVLPEAEQHTCLSAGTAPVELVV